LRGARSGASPGRQGRRYPRRFVGGSSIRL